MFCCCVEEDDGPADVIEDPALMGEAYSPQKDAEKADTAKVEKDEPKPEPKPEPKLQEEPRPEQTPAQGARPGSQPEPKLAPEAGPNEPLKAESFEATVHRAGCSLGMQIDWLPTGIRVMTVADHGAVHAHNKGAKDRIESGMVITAVNGSTSNQDMFKEMAAKDLEVVKMTVVRPAFFTVEVSKGGDKRLGCHLHYRDTESSCVEIRAIEGGAIAEYNSRALGDRQVKVSDFITAANDVSSSAADMTKEITAKDKLKLTIMRVVT